MPPETTEGSYRGKTDSKKTQTMAAVLNLYIMVLFGKLLSPKLFHYALEQ